MGHPNCRDCFYHCERTDTCDYWLIEDRLRGCEPGAGCTQKKTIERYNRMENRRKWDREQGYKMWLEGKSDKEIAAVFGVSPSAISLVRRKEWETAPREEADTPTETTTAAPTSHEKTTAANSQPSLFTAMEILVQGKTGMAAVVTGCVVQALYEGDLAEARRCLDWLLDRAEEGTT